MEHWQTKLQKIADNCCLFCCYLKMVGIEPDTPQGLMAYLQRAKANGYIDDDCTVLDAERLLNNFTGRRYRVLKKDISSIALIRDLTPVRFNYGKNQHWVLVENGQVVWNPLEKSVCVENGTPTTARITNIV